MARRAVSLTWERVSSSSSWGTALSSLARGNRSQRPCRPRRTRRCQSPPLLQGKLCRGKPLSGSRWRTSRDCGPLEPPRSQAAFRDGKRQWGRCRWSTDRWFSYALFKRGFIVIRLTVYWVHTFLTYIVKLCAVAKHEIDISNKLLCRDIVLSIPLVEFGSDHGQIHRPLNDLVVMTSLHEKTETFNTGLDKIHPDTKVSFNIKTAITIIWLSSTEINVTFIFYFNIFYFI